MATPEQAAATQLKNIQHKTAKSLEQLCQMLLESGLTKVSEQRSWLMQQTGLGYGDANAVAILAKRAAEGEVKASTKAGTGGTVSSAAPTVDDALATIYAGKKAGLRPLHDALMTRIEPLGSFETAPKQAYLSLRRKKQFAIVGPATQTAIEIGLNAKTLPADPRLKVMPPGGMCQATTRIESEAQIDAALLGWLKTAFDEAG